MSAKRVNVRRAPRAFFMVKSGLVVTPITRHQYEVELCGWVRPQDLEPVKGTMAESSLYTAPRDGDGEGGAA